MTEQQTKKLEKLKLQYPEIMPDILEKLAANNARFLTKQEQERICTHIANGMTVYATLKKMHIQGWSYQLTKKAYADFDAEIKRATNERTKTVETTLYRCCVGAHIEVRITKLAKLDRDGEPITKNGKQVFYISQKNIVKHKPDSSSIQFYLRAHRPDIYGEKTKTETSTALLPTEQIREEIIAKLRRNAG